MTIRVHNRTRWIASLTHRDGNVTYWKVGTTFLAESMMVTWKDSQRREVNVWTYNGWTHVVTLDSERDPAGKYENAEQATATAYAILHGCFGGAE